MTYYPKRVALVVLFLLAAWPNTRLQAAGDFSISVSPSSHSVVQGGAVQYTATVDSFSGFKNMVVVQITAGLPAGVAVTPTSVGGMGDFNAAFDITTSLSTPPGTYTLTFTGDAGSIVHSTTATLVVNAAPPDFTLSASPSSQTITQGQSATYTVTVTPTNGFNGPVTFSAGGLPAGAAASFDPASVTGSGSSLMTVTTSASTPATPATLTITGTSGSLSHITSVTLNVYAPGADFSLSVTPASQNIMRNDSNPYTVTVTALNGFYGTVNLSVSGIPSDTIANFFPPAVSVPGNSSLSVVVGTAAPLGTYPLTITGTSGSLSHSVTATLVIVSCYPYLELSTPPDVTVVRGGVAHYPVYVDGKCGFDGTVTLSVTGTPAGSSAAFTPPSLYIPNALYGDTTLSVATTGSTPEGAYELRISAQSPAGDGDSAITHLTVAGSTNKFSLSATPTSQNVSQGLSKSYTITLTPARGFSGDVSFSVGGLPYGASASFNPATLPATGTTTLTLSAAPSMPTGPYTLSVLGTSGNLRNYVNVEMVVIAAIGSISGRVTQEDGQTPIAGATVELYQAGSLLTTATSDGAGAYTFTGLSPGQYALMCSTQGRKTYIQSPVTVSAEQTTTQDFPLPLLPSTGPAMKEYIHLGSRLLAIEVNPQEGVDFEQFTGLNYGPVALPPLTIGIVTFAGGQVYPQTDSLPGDTTPVYGTFGPGALVAPGWYCSGCTGTMTINFAQPVSGLSFLLLNGETYNVTYTVQDDLAAQVVVTLPPNYASGKAIIAMPSTGIQQVTISSDAGNAWDFWVDNFVFTSGAQGSMPQGAASQSAPQAVQLLTAPPASSGDVPSAAATAVGGKW